MLKINQDYKYDHSIYVENLSESYFKDDELAKIQI